MFKKLILLLLFASLVCRNYAKGLEFLRPTYVVAGVPVTEAPTKDNFEIKFQLSFGIPIVSDIMHSGIDIFAGYTQDSYWNRHADSAPFRENVYMPGLYVRKTWSGNDGRTVLISGYEHRSNGRDGALSRSYNYLFAALFREYSGGSVIKLCVRPGYTKYADYIAQDMLLKYLGFVDIGYGYYPDHFPLSCSINVTPVFNKSIANVTAGLNCKLSRDPIVPDLFLQFHWGYDEAMIDILSSNGYEVMSDGTYKYAPGPPVPPKAFLRLGVIYSIYNKPMNLL